MLKQPQDLRGQTPGNELGFVQVYVAETHRCKKGIVGKLSEQPFAG